MSSFLLLAGMVMMFCSFVLSLTRLLNCLIVVENLKVLLLFVSMMHQWEETHMFFLALMVIFTVEVVLGLVVLTRLWSFSILMFSVAY
uniref:NADH dehydrogenase subunit 4L n=1 Tax=Allocreadium lobatum TaxID=334451 RepID=UPI003002EBCF|nr:NADH dehydrogenase subunit 4L [Allocreadium lobatum]